MAAFIAAADGNLTAAATWGTVDATSLLYDVTANTVLTTSYVESQSFVPGAITIDGIAVYLTARVASPTGTISCRLAQAGATVAGTEVTINVSDVPRIETTSGTFNSDQLVFFKFAAPVLLVAATAYTVSLKTSSATQISAYRNATAGNWSRLIRTTTTGAPGAGDNFFILPEKTAAATQTNRAVTMDSTAATDYGAASTNKNLPAIGIGDGCSLSYGVAASTNYVLRVSGTIRVWPHGQLNIGTVSTPIPDTSTAVLELDCAADNDFQIIVHGGNSKGWTAQGSPRTAGKLHVMALLNTDEAAGQTTLGVDRDTGWKSGDSVWIASTTRTASQAESKVLNADAGASSIVITVALANAHSGTSPTQAEVVNMTRNVKVRSVTSGTEGAIIIFATAFCDFDWVEFNNLGNASATAMEARTNSSGQFTMDYCSFAEWATRAFFIGTSTDWTNVAMRNTVFATSKAGAINTIEFGSSTDGTWANRVFDNLTMVRGSGEHLEWSNPNNSTVTVTNLRASGSDTDAVLVRAGGAFSNWIIHSNAGDGVIDDSEGWGIFIQGIYCWRNNATGFHISKIMGSTILDTGQLFGNNGTNLSQDANTQGHHFKNLTLAGDTSFATTNGWSGIGSSIQSKAIFEGCTFGVVSGIFTAHTNDLNNNANSFYDITFRNTVLASATEFNGSNGPARSVQRYERVDGNTNVHKVTWPNFGTRSYETTEFTPLSPSQKLAPAGAYDIQGNHLTSSPFRVRVNSGSTVSVAVYVRKDASYAGIAPRLVLKSNAALGVTSDTLLDTFASPINTWEQLSGTTPAASEAGVFEFEIQVTGTGGAVYVDAWSAS